MHHKKIEEVQGWALEKFEKDTKLGSLARMPADILTVEEVEMLQSAREGWLVGLVEAEKGGYSESDVQEASDYSCID